MALIYLALKLYTIRQWECTLWGGLTANKVTASPAAVATKLIADFASGNIARVPVRNVSN